MCDVSFIVKYNPIKEAETQSNFNTSVTQFSISENKKSSVRKGRSKHDTVKGNSGDASQKKVY